MIKKEKFVRNLKTHKGKILTFREDEVLCPNGRTSVRDVIDHNGGVCVAPITGNGELLFVRQYRYSYDEILLELPAGKLEKDETENPLAAGIRELEEETGAKADTVIDLGVFYPTCGYCNEKIYLFAAANLHFGSQKLDPDEFIETEKIAVDKAVDMVMNGEIKDGKSIALILKINELIKNGKLSLHNKPKSEDIYD